MRYLALGVCLLLGSLAIALGAQPPGRGKPRPKPGPQVGSVTVNPAGSRATPFASPAAATADERAARGLGNVIRSTGEANLLNSQAANNYEDARRKEMENRVYGTEAYFEVQKINRDEREAAASPRATQDDLTRFAKENAPKRLTASELDPLTGQIAWPPLLQQAAFAKDRAKLEAVFAQRAKSGRFTPEQRTEVDQRTRSLQTELKKNVSTYPPQDYVQAKRFLEQLAYELYAPAT